MKTYKWAKTLVKQFPMELEAMRILQDLNTRMVFSSKRVQRKKQKQNFSIEEFIVWALNNNYIKVYKNYINKKRQQKYKPSVDRINPLIGYFFENMQILTQEENFKKGYKEMGIIKGTSVLQIDIKTNKIISNYDSILEASKKTKICESSINKVVNGLRRTAGGFYWKVNKNKLGYK